MGRLAGYTSKYLGPFNGLKSILVLFSDNDEDIDEAIDEATNEENNSGESSEDNSEDNGEHNNQELEIMARELIARGTSSRQRAFS